MLPAYGRDTLRCNRISIIWAIEEGVLYFLRYVDRQEAWEEQHTCHKKERAMREAQEYEEWRRMNELLWQQSEAIRQLE